MILFEEIRSGFVPNVCLAPYTTIRVGGNAQYFFEIGSEADLLLILSRCRAYGIPVSLLGNGSNTLVSDYGTEGAVLHFGRGFSGVRTEGETVRVQAGASLPALVRKLAADGLGGLEFACGIPASVGGATVMNCGAFGGEWAERVLFADVIEGGKRKRLSGRDCGFGYRTSIFARDPSLVVLEVGLRMTRESPERIAAGIAEISERRARTQGVTQPSLGSVFRRTEGAPPPAKLIDDCGLKGFRIGGAEVSRRHAGFIVNAGGATCENICALIAHIKSTVREKCGIMLSEEIRRL